MNSSDWVFDTDGELPTVETLRVERKLSAVVLESPKNYFYRIHQTIPPPSTNLDRNLDGSTDCPHISPSTDYYRSPENSIGKKSSNAIQDAIQENNNLQNKMNERTYHEVLSTVVHELLHPFLAVLTPHMRLYKQLHWTRFTSKRRSL